MESLRSIFSDADASAFTFSYGEKADKALGSNLWESHPFRCHPLVEKVVCFTEASRHNAKKKQYISRCFDVSDNISNAYIRDIRYKASVTSVKFHDRKKCHLSVNKLQHHEEHIPITKREIVFTLAEIRLCTSYSISLPFLSEEGVLPTLGVVTFVEIYRVPRGDPYNIQLESCVDMLHALQAERCAETFSQRAIKFVPNCHVLQTVRECLHSEVFAYFMSVLQSGALYETVIPCNLQSLPDKERGVVDEYRRNKVEMNAFRHAMPITLSRRLLKQLAERKDRYYFSEKSNGIRGLLFCHVTVDKRICGMMQYKNSKTWFTFPSALGYVTDKLDGDTLYPLECCLLDVEIEPVVGAAERSIITILDCICWNAYVLQHEPFINRHVVFSQLQQEIYVFSNPFVVLHFKSWTRLSHLDELQSLGESNSSADGIIFVDLDSVYVGGYVSDGSLIKWKPPKLLTMDLCWSNGMWCCNTHGKLQSLTSSLDGVPLPGEDGPITEIGYNADTSSWQVLALREKDKTQPNSLGVVFDTMQAILQNVTLATVVARLQESDEGGDGCRVEGDKGSDGSDGSDVCRVEGDKGSDGSDGSDGNDVCRVEGDKGSDGSGANDSPRKRKRG